MNIERPIIIIAIPRTKPPKLLLTLNEILLQSNVITGLAYDIDQEKEERLSTRKCIINCFYLKWI